MYNCVHAEIRGQIPLFAIREKYLWNNSTMATLHMRHCRKILDFCATNLAIVMFTGHNFAWKQIRVRFAFILSVTEFSLKE